MQMQLPELDVLKNAMKQKSLHLTPLLPEEIDPWAITLAEHKPKMSIDFKFYTSEPNLTDLAGTEFAVLKIVSTKFVETLNTSNVTGWSTYPVRIFDKQGRSVEGYHGLSIGGRCGRINESQARIEKKAMPGGVFDKKVGLYFDPKTWDGSDMFCPEGTAIVIVTEKVKKALEAAKVTNVEFTNVHDYEHSM